MCKTGKLSKKENINFLCLLESIRAAGVSSRDITKKNQASSYIENLYVCLFEYFNFR